MARRSQEVVSDVDTETLLAASKVISAAVAHSLAAVEDQVSVPGLRVLVMIQARGPLNLSAVAEALGVNASSASRTCDRLVSAGLLDRRESPRDRRQVSLTLTPRGQQFVDDVMGERLAILSEVIAAMPDQDRRELMRSLDAFVNAATWLTDHPGLDDSTGRLLRWVI